MEMLGRNRRRPGMRQFDANVGPTARRYGRYDRILHHANISVKMITGDHVNVGKETARLSGLRTDIQAGEAIRNTKNLQERKQMMWDADGFAVVLPSDKREVVLTL